MTDRPLDPEADSIYAAFACASYKCWPVLVVPLALVVLLQLALLSFVTVAWTGAQKAANVHDISTIRPIGSPCSNSEDAWSSFVLCLTNIGALCALAVVTHAEVQAAVNVFDKLREMCEDASSAPPDGEQHSTASPWRLLVPSVQLLVAALMLLVQGVVFMSYRIDLVSEDKRYAKVLDAVYASVALAFICELDNKVWVFVKPLMQQSTGATSDSDSPTSRSSRQDGGLLVMLACSWPWCSSCSRRANRPHCCCAALLCSNRGCCFARFCCSCKQFLSVVFHVLLFAYECIFGMLLVLYATDYATNNCPAQLASAAIFGFGCFIMFQLVAGVRSSPLRASACDSTLAGWCLQNCQWSAWNPSGCGMLSCMLSRPVALNMIAPLLVGGVTRIMWTMFTSQVAASEWRCRAGAVIECTTCNRSVTWCTATIGCAKNCTDGRPSAVGCSANWCHNQSCTDCLRHKNDTMPIVDFNTSIHATDGMYMCHGISSAFWCMHLWGSFLPFCLVLLLACVFLGYESSRSTLHQAYASSVQASSAAEAARAEAAAKGDTSCIGNDQLLQHQCAHGVRPPKMV